MVSALELLAGFDNALSEKFPEAKMQIELAFQLSKGAFLKTQYSCSARKRYESHFLPSSNDLVPK